MLAEMRLYIEQSIQLKQELLADTELLKQLNRTAEVCIESLAVGGKILLAGNGGSAADCQHIAAELVGRFELERQSLAALALTTDTSSLTAIANDFGYSRVFERQLSGLARAEDVFIVISTSGNSENLIAAVERAKALGVTTVGLLGVDGALNTMCDICLPVPSRRTALIQESHIMLGHILCNLIEQHYSS